MNGADDNKLGDTTMKRHEERQRYDEQVDNGQNDDSQEMATN
jgi:hypothetical protein